jgi:hypothetical protein
VRARTSEIAASRRKAASLKKNLTASSRVLSYACCANATAPWPPMRRPCLPSSLHHGAMPSVKDTGKVQPNVVRLIVRNHLAAARQHRPQGCAGDVRGGEERT